MKSQKNKQDKKVERPDPSPSLKERRGVRIRNPQDCTRLLNKLINKVLVDNSPEEQWRLKAITYAVSTLLKAFEVGELEERIKTLEGRLNEKS